ncbi:uncharacterized protein BDR25DRAFT_337944 [Lindgomyces ingoldianus]|uniref:Uncharacterized protein n=1 Tax=Lindgomyces ingoldianus TaxID=673940 RepID=A0ACB6Q9M7_9PLEO|nr:uncharacterized protein BDR25DRAFT_337944 [Lindgomyces ingoldianus]KAF2463283.1 hypothetical protein BDR25DRAFT_337944 [Lindgomyces ingoldianus]
MHPAVSLIAENVLKNQALVVALLFPVLATVANVDTPVQHSLLVTAVSWALIWIPAVCRAGLGASGSGGSKKATSWAAGGFLAFAQICDRAACDKEGIWSTKALLPLLVVLLSESEIWSHHFALPSYHSLDDSSDSGAGSERKSHARSYRLLVIVTVAAAAALSTRYSSSPTTTLGLSSVLFAAVGLVLFESALKTSKDDNHSGRRGFVSADGTFSRPNPIEGTQREHHIATLRDVAAIMTILCGLAAYLVEPMTPNGFTWEPVYRQLPGDWKAMQHRRTVQISIWMIVVDVIVNTLFFFITFQQGAVHTSFLVLFSYMCARLHLAVSFSGLWFTVIYSATALLIMTTSSTSSSIDLRSSIRLRRIIFGVTAASFGFLFLRYASGARRYPSTTHDLSTFGVVSPESPFSPVPMDLKKGHPAEQLIESAEKRFGDLLNRQSKSLGEAVQEYRRRHGFPPPPNFDKWYEFATRNGVQLIDEFDTITRSLYPFWALKPSTIRARVRLALGSDENALIGMMIRDGSVVKIENGQEWQQQATTGMIKDFVQYLPDMDLAFNIHDEPRVVVPHDQLSFLVTKARDHDIPNAMRNPSPQNAFSPRPSDMNDGRRFEEAKTTKFNRFAHQQTWTVSRLSCSQHSQARNYEDSPADNLTSYAVGPLNYVYNVSAFSDICNSPSFSSSFGFFERPNAFNIVHELTPIFSQSKISSFQDILYPSPWYWFGRVGYDEDRDTTWENKTNAMYWRGSTTGGFSRSGGWRRQHRQHIVRNLNAPSKAKILVSKSQSQSHLPPRDSDPQTQTPELVVKDVDRKSLTRLIDVKFSHIGQCDPGDCDAQKEFFNIAPRADGQDAWYFKHLLDMDGNAFSGRFYAFLRSRSLTYKMAVFREWHQEWLRPWVHYVPLSLKGEEHLDLVRWFGGVQEGDREAAADGQGGEGKEGRDRDRDRNREKDRDKPRKDGNGESVGEKKAREIAERSSEWAGKVLRNVDFEVWFFRLLLEYGRIIDDNRDMIGYPGP